MKLESENARLQEQIKKERECAQHLKKKHKDSEQVWRTKDDALNDKLMALTDKNSQLNDKIHQLNDREISSLKRELTRVKKIEWLLPPLRNDLKLN